MAQRTSKSPPIQSLEPPDEGGFNPGAGKEHPYAIVGFSARDLYGYICHDIRTDSANHADISRLAILYGENGTGKTTILNLIWHLISPHTDRGHKSAIAAIPFKSVSVELRDGTMVSARRKEAAQGSYRFSVKCPGQRSSAMTIPVAEHDPRSVPHYAFPERIREALDQRSSAVFFLGDDRLINIELPSNHPIPGHYLTGPLPRQLRRKRAGSIDGIPTERRRHHPSDSESLAEALEDATDRLQRLIAHQYARLTNTGMQSTHGVYAAVLKQLSSAKYDPDSDQVPDSLIPQLEALAAQSARLAEFGLAAEFGAAEIVKSLNSTRKRSSDRLSIALQLLAPYLESTLARFSELSEVEKVIRTYVELLNTFLAPKVVTYHVRRGVRVLSPAGAPLAPGNLSSGEKHLMLLLTSAILARDARTIFIIDEPEISLNSTWQRDVVSALLALSEGSVNQYLLASHALPLLAGHRQHVLRMNSQAIGR